MLRHFNVFLCEYVLISVTIKIKIKKNLTTHKESHLDTFG